VTVKIDNSVLVKFVGWRMRGLVWYGCLVAGFFDYREYLFEFSEVFEYGYASLSDGEDYSAFAYGAFFD